MEDLNIIDDSKKKFVNLIADLYLLKEEYKKYSKNILSKIDAFIADYKITKNKKNIRECKNLNKQHEVNTYKYKEKINNLNKKIKLYSNK